MSLLLQCKRTLNVYKDEEDVNNVGYEFPFKGKFSAVKWNSREH